MIYIILAGGAIIILGYCVVNAVYAHAHQGAQGAIRERLGL